VSTHACKAGGWKCGRFRDEARWSGALTQHCTVCGELFLGGDAADAHATLDGNGDVVCHDPASRTRGDGAPMFEKVPKPTWDPPYAWRRFRPDRPEHPQALATRNLRASGGVAGTSGTHIHAGASENAARFAEVPS